MHKYVKKPVQIEAVEWTGNNIVDIVEFCPKCFGKPIPGTDSSELVISTLEGPMKASVGDYIIKGLVGEFYACKPDVFLMTYDKVN